MSLAKNAATVSGLTLLSRITGLARENVTAAVNGQRVELRLRFLGVWREESGRWKLLSYQSSQVSGN